MNKVVIQNEVECLKCGQRIHSKHRHDFVRCQCGNIAVDGGMAYLKRVGGEHGYTDLSITLEEHQVSDIIGEMVLMEQSGRNMLGILCAAMRKLRDHNLLHVVTEEDQDRIIAELRAELADVKKELADLDDLHYC